MFELRCIVRGRVQAVNFRAFAAERARELGLRGTVKNCADGTLEIVAQGDRSNLEALKRLCEIGPKFADVTGLKDDWREIASATYTDFRIMF